MEYRPKETAYLESTIGVPDINQNLPPTQVTQRPTKSGPRPPRPQYVLPIITTGGGGRGPGTLALVPTNPHYSTGPRTGARRRQEPRGFAPLSLRPPNSGAWSSPTGQKYLTWTPGQDPLVLLPQVKR